MDPKEFSEEFEQLLIEIEKITDEIDELLEDDRIKNFWRKICDY